MKTTALLLLSSLLTASAAVEIPTDPSYKYWPNGRPQGLDKRSPNPASPPQILGVKKITTEDEKFYPSYWLTGTTITDFYGSEVNVTDSQFNQLLKPAIRPTLSQPLTSDGVLRLFKRQSEFNCPTNHYKCTSISRPNFCCGNDETCAIIPDGGIGDVGCCPKGQNCLGTVRNCGDKTACSKEMGGGCCVAGYGCTVNGCVPLATQTTTTNIPTQTACGQGFYACPASLGGGCCRVGRGCAVSDCPATNSPTSSPTPTQTAIDNSNCPSGYFSCGAEFSGGCCRVGRVCAVSSCPVATGTTVPSLIVGGTCADGWFGCPADKAGGCCPDGYDCGLLDCPAKGANTPAAQKANIIPGAGARTVVSVGAVMVGVLAGMGMVML